MRRFLSFLVFLASFFSCTLTAQSRFIARNSIQLELGGYGIHYSVNYNRILSNSRNGQVEGRIGVCVLPIGIGIPVVLSGILLPAPHHLQISLGGNVFVDNRQFNGTDTFLYLGPAIGYRFDPGNQKWLAYFTINPMWKTDPTRTQLIDPNPVRILTGALGIGWKLD